VAGVCGVFVAQGSVTMKVSYAGFLLLLLSAGLIGCNTRESPKGGPGREAAQEKGDTNRDNNRNAPGTPVATDNNASNKTANDTFAVDVPKSVSVTQGRQERTSVSINRGRTFEQAVTVSFKSDSSDIRVTPERKEIPRGEKKMDVTVEAGDNATVGDHVIEVTGRPETGDATSVRMTVTVKKK